MSVPGSLGRPWSNNPNAPQIPYPFYTAEKTTFAGALISVIFYGTVTPTYPLACTSVQSIVLGIVIILFFQCIDALLNPVDRTRGGIQWGFVAHTTAMFSFMTIYIVTGIYILLTAYIDNRGFHGVDSLPPGPVGDRLFLYHKSIGIVPQVMFILNNWLADGLLVSPVLASVAQVFNPPVISLLCHLRHELSGYRIPMLDVPRLYRYAIKFPTSVR